MVMKVTQCSSNWRPLIKTYRVQFQRKKERKKEKESKSSHHFLYSHGRRSAFAFTITTLSFCLWLRSRIFRFPSSFIFSFFPFLPFLSLTCINNLCSVSLLHHPPSNIFNFPSLNHIHILSSFFFFFFSFTIFQHLLNLRFNSHRFPELCTLSPHSCYYQYLPLYCL